MTLRFLASRKVALVLLGIAIVLSFATAEFQEITVWPLVAALAALIASLVACLIISGASIWRRSKALFLFHIGLLGLAACGPVSALFVFNGFFLLTEGQSVSDEFVPVRQSPLYSHRLQGFELELLSAEVTFNAGDDAVKSGDHLVRVTRPAGTVDETIRYNHPILYGDYRFYLSKNQGAAAVFRYRPNEPGAVERPGVVYLPTYPETRNAQIAEFSVRGRPGDDISVKVTDPAELPYIKDRPWSLTVPSDLGVTLSYTSDRNGRERADLRPGSTVDVGHGIVTYEGARIWQRFIVDYDPSRPWIAAFAALTLASITWHYVQVELTRIRQSWRQRGRTETTKEHGQG